MLIEVPNTTRLAFKRCETFTRWELPVELCVFLQVWEGYCQPFLFSAMLQSWRSSQVFLSSVIAASKAGPGPREKRWFRGVLLYVILNELIVRFWGKHVKVTNLYHFFNYYSVLEKSKRLCRIRPLGEAAMDTKGFCLKTADVFTTNKLLESGKHLTEEALIWFDFTERFFFFHSQFFFFEPSPKVARIIFRPSCWFNFLNLFYYGKSKSDGNVLHRNFEVIISSTIFSTDTLECKEKMHVFSWRWSWCGIALNLDSF